MQKAMKNFLLVCASCIVALIVLEIFLRCIGFSYPSFYWYDKATGSAHRPGAEGWWREEGEGFVKINSHGMRDDREISKKKPAGVYRIAVLGDSYAEAFQIQVKDSFWRVLENEANACKAFNGKKVEVLNFGVAGYSTIQELLALRSRVWGFQPDMVLLAFLSGNDVRDNHPDLCQLTPRAFFMYKDGSLSLDNTFFQSTAFRIKSSFPYQQMVNFLDHFRMYQFAKKVKRSFIILYETHASRQSGPQADTTPGKTTVKPPAAGAISAGKQISNDIGLDNYIYLLRQSREWEEAWRISEDLIEQMHKEVVAHGARFLLVTLTNGIQVHPDTKARDDFAKAIGCGDLLYPDRRIESFAAAHGIEAIILAPIMQKYAEQRKQYFHGFPNTIMGGGHWNENGHHTAGKIIAEFLCNSEEGTMH